LQRYGKTLFLSTYHRDLLSITAISYAFFDVLYHICGLLISKHPKSNVLRNIVNINTNHEIKLSEERPRIFDFYQICERISIISGACWLLSNWPSHFIDICKKHKLYASDILREINNCPFWFSMPIKQNLSLVCSDFKNYSTEIPYDSTYAKYGDQKIKKKDCCLH